MLPMVSSPAAFCWPLAAPASAGAAARGRGRRRIVRSLSPSAGPEAGEREQQDRAEGSGERATEDRRLRNALWIGQRRDTARQRLPLRGDRIADDVDRQALVRVA